MAMSVGINYVPLEAANANDWVVINAPWGEGAMYVPWIAL